MTRRATVADVIERRRPAHELRADLHDLWRDGFTAGAQARQREVDRANDDADYWYLRARYTDAEIDAMHQAAIDAAFESGEARWLDHAEPMTSWAEAREGADHA